MTAPRVETLLVPEFRLDSGVLLRDVTIAHGLLGKIASGGGNVVLIFHSLTGGPADLGGFFPDVVGPERAVDTRRIRRTSQTKTGTKVFAATSRRWVPSRWASPNRGA